MTTVVTTRSLTPARVRTTRKLLNQPAGRRQDTTQRFKSRRYKKQNKNVQKATRAGVFRSSMLTSQKQRHAENQYDTRFNKRQFFRVQGRAMGMQTCTPQVWEIPRKDNGGGEARGGDCSRPKYRKREAEQVGIPSCSRTMDPLMPNLKTERKSDGKTRRSHPPLSDPGLHIFRLCARFFAYRHRESERERGDCKPLGDNVSVSGFVSF